MALTADNFNIPNATPADRASLDLALGYLSRSPDATALMQQLANERTPINFVHGDEPAHWPMVSDQKREERFHLRKAPSPFRHGDSIEEQGRRRP